MHCTEIWCVVRYLLDWRFAKVNGWVYVPPAHLFSVSRDGWTGCAETWCVVSGPLAMRFTQDEGYPHERALNAFQFKHICSLPLVHRPEGVKASYW